MEFLILLCRSTLLLLILDIKNKGRIMLDWEFDELIEDIQIDMEDSNEDLDPRELIAASLDDYESDIVKGEVEEITVILSMFMTPFKNLIMKTSDYNILNKTIEKYNLMDKNNFTNHQKEKIEEMIDFYNENIHKIKLWGRDKERREIYHQVVLDEQGNRILLEIKE